MERVLSDTDKLFSFGFFVDFNPLEKQFKKVSKF